MCGTVHTTGRVQLPAHDHGYSTSHHVRAAATRFSVCPAHKDMSAGKAETSVTLLV